MSQLVSDCPRCKVRSTTFDVESSHEINRNFGWQATYEAFAICRHCKKATTFILKMRQLSDHILQHGIATIGGSLNDWVTNEGYISLKDYGSIVPPQSLPTDIKNVFIEGATCHLVGCWNAASTMFRLCVDLATKTMLPEADIDGLNPRIRFTLGLRLKWLFDHQRIPEGLRELSLCIKEDGNDGAHVGSLMKEDAGDVLDFTVALLERLYTEPEQLRIAKERRDQRRSPKKTSTTV